MCARRRSFRKESSGTPHDGGNPGHRDHVLWEGASNGQRAVKPRLARTVSGDLVVARRSRNRSVPQCDGGGVLHINRQIVLRIHHNRCSGHCASVLDRVSKQTAARMSQIDSESASFRELVTQALGITNRQTCAAVVPMKATDKSAGKIQYELPKD